MPDKGPEEVQGERSPAEIEAARKLFAGPCEFVAGAASLESMIPISLPEVAFAGRSNVGKSSLVNALTGRRASAASSAVNARETTRPGSLLAMKRDASRSRSRSMPVSMPRPRSK